MHTFKLAITNITDYKNIMMICLNYLSRESGNIRSCTNILSQSQHVFKSCNVMQPLIAILTFLTCFADKLHHSIYVFSLRFKLFMHWRTFSVNFIKNPQTFCTKSPFVFMLTIFLQINL